MRANSKWTVWSGLILAGLTMMSSFEVGALGADYPKGGVVVGPETWPTGMSHLVNTTNRVHGFFINAEDTFCFSGGSSDFTLFLKEYSELSGVAERRLILHEGTGNAVSPWEKNSRACDWKLTACPASWRQIRAGSTSDARARENIPGYVVEVHFWTGGRIDLKSVTVPQTVVILKNQ